MLILFAAPIGTDRGTTGGWRELPAATMTPSLTTAEEFQQKPALKCLPAEVLRIEASYKRFVQHDCLQKEVKRPFLGRQKYFESTEILKLTPQNI